MANYGHGNTHVDIPFTSSDLWSLTPQEVILFPYEELFCTVYTISDHGVVSEPITLPSDCDQH